MQLGEPPQTDWWGLFNRIWIMAAGANFLWNILPHLFVFLPDFQLYSSSGTTSNVTRIAPISDLIHRPFSEQKRLQLLQDTKEMFYWGYDNYMMHAFPFDELNPVNCTGRGHDWIDQWGGCVCVCVCVCIRVWVRVCICVCICMWLWLLNGFLLFLRTNVNVNDALGDYSLTLVDTLDTLAVSQASSYVHTTPV